VTRTAVATSAAEVPLFFPSEHGTLFGILTKPVTDAARVTVVFLSGGSTPTAMNRNRLSVRLARGVAALGYGAFRFDYHGIGESFGSQGRFRLDAPFATDVTSAVRALEEPEPGRFVLFGSCFGARTALASSGQIGDLAGVILVSPPIRDFEMGERISTRMVRELTLRDYVRRALRPEVAKRMFHRRWRHSYRKIIRAKARTLSRSHRDRSSDPYSWVSQVFLDQLEDLVRRQIPTLIVYGTHDDLYREFVEAQAGRLGRILRRGEHVEVKTIEGTLHGFMKVSAQEQTADLTFAWLDGMRSLSNPQTR